MENGLYIIFEHERGGKLLTFKPFLLNQDEMKLYPATLPDWEWPALQIVTSPCPAHPDEPAEDCTCGVYSSLDTKAMGEFYKAPFNMIQDVIPVLGVVQVLGQTFIDRFTMRSWGAFLWGLVQPYHWKGTVEWRELMRTDVNNWDDRFNPVVYRSFTHAALDILPTLKSHNLDNYIVELEKEIEDDSTN